MPAPLDDLQPLEPLVCICMHCKRVRSDGDWVEDERHAAARSAAQCSHGLCLECYERAYGGEESRQEAPPRGGRAT